MRKKKSHKKYVLLGSGIGFMVCFFVLSYAILPDFFRSSYEALAQPSATTTQKIVPKRIVTHIPTPSAVKAIYMTSWVAGTSDIRRPLVSLIDETEINSVVIDIKDYTGEISFEVNDPFLQSVGSGSRRIVDIDDFIDLLHSKGIYVIGRISVFQDQYFVKKHPEFAVKKNSDRTVPWADRKGIQWLDAGSHDVWDYIVAIGKEAYGRGFDELNFDYIRFPSDGNMNDVYYPWSGTTTKSVVLNSFFEHIKSVFSPLSIPISADLFGMTTTNTDDLNIGQVLEHALVNFDFVAPMVYPSHYPPGWNNFKDPESYPYEVINISMKAAVDRANIIGVSPLKLRPWLQDFGLRMSYGAKEVKAQIQATEDVGLTSWMLWNASNKYTKGALSQASTTIQ